MSEEPIFPDAAATLINQLTVKLRNTDYAGLNRIRYGTAEFPKTPFERIPWSWQEVICLCENPEYPDWGAVQSGKQPPVTCIKCHKRSRWSFLYCNNCDKLYDYWFWHHALNKMAERQFSSNSGAASYIAATEFELSFPPATEKHPFVGWANGKNLCWTCITSVDPAVEGDRPPQFVTAPRGNPKVDYEFEISFD